MLGRAEAFAFKNPLLPSIADGLGIGVGFTLSLAAIAGIREALGAGTVTVLGNSFSLFGDAFLPFAFMVQAPGAFVCLGLMLCIMNMLGSK